MPLYANSGAKFKRWQLFDFNYLKHGVTNLFNYHIVYIVRIIKNQI